MFRGRELYSKTRRVVADVTAAKRNVTCQPVDRQMDPRTAEAAKFPVEHVVKTPSYGFETYFERAVWSAVAARRGWMVFEWDARINDLVIRNADPRRVFKCPPYRDTWDRTIPWVIEQVPVSLKDAQERFPDLDLVADFSGSDLNNQLGRNDVTNTLQSNPQLDPNQEGRCLMLMCWAQFDDETAPTVIGKRPVEQPYAFCPNCGYKSGPEDVGMPCPECGTPMQMAQSEDFVADLPKFPMGRVLEYVFPLQNKCERGPWPTGPNGEQLRMPPLIEFRRSEHPIEDCGLSDTAVDAPMQTLSNQLMERLRRQVQGPSALAAIYGEPEDKDGNPWEPNDDPWQMAYFKDPTSKVAVENLADVSPALFNAINMVQQQFRADLGTVELSANQAQDLKGIQVGVTEQAVQSGSVPTDHLIRTCQRSLAHAYGVISDWLRIGWTEGTWVRYQGALGMADYQLVKGADIPNVDFVFGEGPEQDFADKQQLQGAMAWYQTGLPPNGSPALRRALAAAGLAPVPMEVVDQIEKAEADQLDAQQQAMGAGGGPIGPDAASVGPPGMTPPGPEAGGPPMNGAPPFPGAMMAQRG